MPLSQIIQSLKQQGDVAYFDEIEWDSAGYWETEYYNEACAKIEIKVDPRRQSSFDSESYGSALNFARHQCLEKECLAPRTRYVGSEESKADMVKGGDPDARVGLEPAGAQAGGVWSLTDCPQILSQKIGRSAEADRSRLWRNRGLGIFRRKWRVTTVIGRG